MKDLWKRKGNQLWFSAGLLAVLVMLIPYLLLGHDAIVTYHDQLDGEIIAYLLQAKHLFEGSVLPEFLNGAAKTALTPPAPACVLLFLGGNAFAAYVCMQLMGSLCGYVGMYLLIREAGKSAETRGPVRNTVSFAAAAVGVLYAYLPFLPVYGLSQYGLPLLLWYLQQLRHRKHTIGAFLYGAFYVLNSSLILIGFGVLGMSALWIGALALSEYRRKKNTPPEALDSHGEGWEGVLKLAGLWGMMFLLYLAENISLLRQMLGGEGSTVSHKAEYVLAPVSFFTGFLQNLFQDGQHTRDFHSLFLGAALLTALVCLVKKIGRRQLELMGLCAGCNIFLALVSALWDAAPGIAVRERLGALGSFQLNRLLWISPCLWYLILGCTLILVLKLWSARELVIPLSGILCWVVTGALLLITGAKVLLASNLKPNLQKLWNEEYAAMSFGDYYGEGVLDQVQDFIRETTGQAPEEYRVVSLGIDPAAALYHGFYCLDGYSNNYSLEYKHVFRQIIVSELEKSEYLRNYFDTWGNRCYLFSAETPAYYTIEKGGFYFQDYSLNAEKLKELGGRYLFSAAYIANAREQGLVLMREEAFETADSYYRIFLYEIAGAEGASERD